MCKKNPKIKIFMGNFGLGKRADEVLGDWLEVHPKVKIIDFQYQQARYGDHSIAIMYEEEE